MKDKDFLIELINRAESRDTGYFQFAHIVACELDKKLCEQLQQLVNGPVWDGDVICKSYRDELLTLGLAVRVCRDGETGFTGGTYLAHTVCKVINDIRAGKVGA